MNRGIVRRRRPTLLIFFATAIAALLVTGPGNDDSEPWGASAEQFFATWADAWSTGDAFDTVRFYAPDVAIRSAQPDLELTNPAAYWDTTTQGDGRAWLAGWLADQTRTRERSVAGLYIDESVAAVVLTIDSLNTSALHVMAMEDGEIAGQTTLRWRNAHKPGGVPDARLDWVDDLVAGWVSAWSDPDPIGLSAVYRPDAAVLPFPADPARGIDAIIDERDRLALDGAHVPQIGTGPQAGPAIFVVPRSTTSQVGFIVESGRDEDGCLSRIAITLRLDGNRIIEERRLPDPNTVRTCHAPQAESGGWWDGLTIPPPVESQVTGAVAHPDGVDIVVFNGAPVLERLLSWGLGRFENAGLEPPALSSVTFGPTPACESGRAGTLSENRDGAPRLVLCTDVYGVCGGASDCTGFALTSRMGMLHELAHAWLAENVEGPTIDDFLELAGLSTWHNPEVAWHLNGVEHAADTTAWGLLDEQVRLIRLGDPSCEQSATGFLLLTGVGPAIACGT